MCFDNFWLLLWVSPPFWTSVPCLTLAVFSVQIYFDGNPGNKMYFHGLPIVCSSLIHFTWAVIGRMSLPWPGNGTPAHRMRAYRRCRVRRRGATTTWQHGNMATSLPLVHFFTLNSFNRYSRIIRLWTVFHLNRAHHFAYSLRGRPNALTVLCGLHQDRRCIPVLEV